jgi:hypothetical protein
VITRFQDSKKNEINVQPKRLERNEKVNLAKSFSR